MHNLLLSLQFPTGCRRLTGRQGFTLIELLTVIAIIAILAAILFPVYGKAKAACFTARCSSNLKQIGIAVKQYCADYGDRMPVIDTLFTNTGTMPRNYDPFRDPSKKTPAKVIGPYLKDERLLVCPTAVNGVPSSGSLGTWRQTYVFYGRDYEQTIYGGEEASLDLDQFKGQIQQQTLAHGQANAESATIWVRDSILKTTDRTSRSVRFPHGNNVMSRLYADGHVSKTRPEPHALNADF